MAKKEHSKKALAYKKQMQKTQRPGARLQEARQALQSGDLARALSLADSARHALGAHPGDSTTGQQVKELLAELHFRLAAASNAPALRLQHLDAALDLAPDGATQGRAVLRSGTASGCGPLHEQARLHYHRGLTLWRMGNPRAAVPAFERVAQLAPAWPGIAYLRQLGNLATGQPWNASGLSPTERGTLQLLHDLLQGKDAAQMQATPGGRLDKLSLLGGQPMWTVLLNMAAKPTAAPLDDLQISCRRRPEAGALWARSQARTTLFFTIIRVSLRCARGPRGRPQKRAPSGVPGPLPSETDGLSDAAEISTAWPRPLATAPTAELALLQVQHRLLHLAMQIEHIQGQLEHLIAETEQSGGQIEVVTRQLTTAPVTNAVHEQLAQLATQLADQQEQLLTIRLEYIAQNAQGVALYGQTNFGAIKGRPPAAQPRADC
jgi:hypothetical protein